MKSYHLHVSMPSTKMNPVVIATYFVIEKKRINFLNEAKEVICSYPSRYTIIEKIT